MPTQAFDTATRQPLRFRLPHGYHAGPADELTLFEWLDDDTVALFHGSDAAEIFTCHVPDGRCHLAVKAKPSGTWRIVPDLSLPG